MAKFCQQCGSPLPEASKFCQNCGAPVPQPAQPPAPPAPPVQASAPAAAPAPPPAQPAQPTPPPQPAAPDPAPQPPVPPVPPTMSAPPFPAPLTYPPAGAPGQPLPPKKGKTGLLIGIIAAVLVVLGVTAFFGFRDGGFLRGFDPRVPSGWSQTDATTRKTRKTRKTKSTTEVTTATTTEATTTTTTEATTGKPTATTAKPTAAPASPSADIGAVAGTYPFTGDYKEYFGETVVEEGTLQGSIEFTVSGSQLVAAFLPKEEGDISFPMTYDPATMTATYESADESLIRSFTVTFYEAGGNMCMGAVMQDDYPYSDIPSGTYYLNGARDYPQ